MARRSRGSGTVIALVIFVVLTFIAAGAAVWFYQQASAARIAMNQNQEAFKKQIVQYFSQQDWDMATATEPGVLNVQYDSSSYSAVRAQLQKAATFEKLSTVTGWKSPSAAKAVLADADLSEDLNAQYETVSGLLAAYEQAYNDKKQTNADLARKVKSLNEQLNQKTKALANAEESLNAKLNDAISEYDQNVDEWAEKHKKLAQTHQEQTEKTEQWRQRYRQAKDEAEQKMENLQTELAQWKETVQKLRAGEQPEKMTAQGEVLELDRQYKIAMVGGGEDLNRKRDERLVVYKETAAGKRIKKGEVVVTKVHPHTAATTVVSEVEDAMISEGDSCVTLDTWKHFEGSKAASSETSEEKQES